MTIRPFAALRPSRADAPFVASVPYDVVDVAGAKALAAGNPKSFLHVSRPEIDLPEGTSGSSAAAFAQARKALDALTSGGTLRQDPVRRFYAYRQTMGGRSQTGIVAAFDAKEYESGAIKRHEFTRKDKEDERARHIEVLGAQTGPAFFAFRDNAGIDAIVAEACAGEPLFDFTAPDGVGHAGWTIGDEGGEAAERLAKIFADEVGAVYIADGHHRTAAAARFAAAHGYEGEGRWIMAVAFPESQLRILPYNRLVKGFNGLSQYEFLSAVSQNFEIDAKGERGCRMYCFGRWFDLSWSVPEGADAVSSLDVSRLQERLLGPVLGIADPRTDKRISFEGGITGEAALKAKVDAGEADVAFSMKGVSMGEIMAIADAGAVMPPKSTWFEPKLRSGLFVHKTA